MKENFTIILRPDWQALSISPNSNFYERYLSKLRTVSQVVMEMGIELIVELPSKDCLRGEGAILDLWVSLPKFERRDEAQFPVGEALPEEAHYPIHVSGNSLSLGDGVP
jgi:hypothetical protein